MIDARVDADEAPSVDHPRFGGDRAGGVEPPASGMAARSLSARATGRIDLGEAPVGGPGPGEPPQHVLTDASLIAVGHALPEERWPQALLSGRIASAWGLEGAPLERWRRIVEGSAIEHRHGVRPIEPTFALSTAERMEIFALEAPALAARAARSAMLSAEVAAASITDLIVVTCTGFAAPGVDVALVDRLGLAPSVRRAQLGFMGCFGAISGVRAAVGACCADPRSTALVVCVELCTLHLRRDLDPANLVATALFGDGAAAAVVAGAESAAARRLRDPAAGDASAPESGAPRRTGPVGTGSRTERAAPAASSSRSGRDAVGSAFGACSGAARSFRPRSIGVGRPMLFPTGRDAMTWTITDEGFAMNLSRAVPAELRRGIAAAARAGGASERTRFAVHPGGPGILDAIDAGLELGGGRGIEHAWGVLRDVGNISSGSVLLVLERLLRGDAIDVPPVSPAPGGAAARGAAADPIMLLAFGPGLTIETLVIGAATSRPSIGDRDAAPPGATAAVRTDR